MIILLGQGLIGLDLDFLDELLPVELVGGAIITVDDDGGHDHLTIKAAVEAANPGDTIQVNAGEYNGYIVIDKALTIQGSGDFETIIECRGEEPAIWVKASGVSLSGLFIKNKLGNTYENGIFLDFSNNCTITNNKFEDNYVGIWIDDSKHNTISNNHCDNNEVHGIYIKSSNSNTISDNSCIKNSADGISLYRSSNNIIYDNYCERNSDEGISLSESCSNEITKNSCYSSPDSHGIYLFQNCDNNVVRNNTCGSNRENGINVAGSDGNRFTNNTLVNNHESGLRVSSSHSNIITRNYCESNRNGLLINGRENIISNNIATNGTVGIYIMDSRCTYANNTCDNNYRGMRLRFTTDNLIINNTLESNSYGMSIESSYDNDIEKNRFTSNSVGVYLDRSYTNNIVYNVLRESQSFGINISDDHSHENKIHHNALIDNNEGKVQTNDDGPDNVWNDGSNRGNYWSDHTSRYPGSDHNKFVWNTPYEMEGTSNSVDGFPLCADPLETIKPTMVSDRTTEPTTGDEFTFKADFSDNYFVVSVKVYYTFDQISYDEGIMTNTSSATWAGTISVPINRTVLHYRFHAGDAAGNTLLTPVKTLNIIDNDGPELISASILNEANTGDDLTISALFMDNMDVEVAYINHSSDDKINRSTPMVRLTENQWNGTVSVIPEATLFNYYFYIKDINGNTNESHAYTIVVLDNDPPEMVSDETPREVNMGETPKFSVRLFDNIAVKTVYVNCTYNGIDRFSLLMDRSSDEMWELTMTVDADAESIEYNFYFIDSAGNQNATQPEKVMIRDNIKPVVNAGPDRSVDMGDKVILDGSLSTDNIGISKYTWYLLYEEKEIIISGVKTTFVFDIPGVYTITLIALDGNGNSDRDVLNITVNQVDTSDDDDLDDDDIDDDIEDDDIEEDDTTGENNTNGDDDRNNSNTKKEKKQSFPLWLVLCILALVIAIVIFIIGFSIIKKKRQVESDPSNPVGNIDDQKIIIAMPMIINKCELCNIPLSIVNNDFSCHKCGSKYDANGNFIDDEEDESIEWG